MRRFTGHTGHTNSELDQPNRPTGATRPPLGNRETNGRDRRQGPALCVASFTGPPRPAIILGLLIATAGVSPLHAANPTTEDRSPAFAVKVYNYAEVSPKTLVAAKRHAAKVYRKIGIETSWIDCPLKPDQAERYPECAALGNGPSVLNLQILSKEMTERLRFNTKTFGFALPTTGREFANRANVFAHRVEELAYLGRPSKAEIMGYVMAHEVGHLFLGPGKSLLVGIDGLPMG